MVNKNKSNSRLRRYQRDRLWKVFPHRCIYCTVSITFELTEPRFIASKDHVVPIAFGGRNAVANMVLACKPCNMERATKAADEFFISKREKLLKDDGTFITDLALIRYKMKTGKRKPHHGRNSYDRHRDNSNPIPEPIQAKHEPT